MLLSQMSLGVGVRKGGRLGSLKGTFKTELGGETGPHGDRWVQSPKITKTVRTPNTHTRDFPVRWWWTRSGEEPRPLQLLSLEQLMT